MNELESIRRALAEFDKVKDPTTGGWVMAVRHLLPIAEAAAEMTESAYVTQGGVKKKYCEYCGVNPPGHSRSCHIGKLENALKGLEE